MRARLLFLSGITLIGLGLVARQPHIKVSTPKVRYHGYLLNHKAIQHAKQLTVLISAEGFGGIERGTGVILDATHILTCDHVASNSGDETLVYFYPGWIYAHAHTVYADRSKDLAIMEIDVPVRGVQWPVFQEEYFDGQPVTIIGNILGSMKWFVSYGIISGENSRDLYTDGLILGGNSGGPWINDKGEIVALSDWGLEEHGVPVGINGGISAKTINQFLRDWKKPGLQSFLDMLQGIGAPSHAH